MPVFAAGRRARLGGLLMVLTALLLLAGCEKDEAGPRQVTTTPDRPSPPPSDFPATAGRTLGEVIDQADRPDPSDPVVTPLSQVFYPGQNRFAFVLSERDGSEIADAEVAIYVAPIPGGRKNKKGDPYEQPARGPFTARMVSLATDPEFRSDETERNPLAATGFYVTELTFPRKGDWRIEALIRRGDRLIAKSLPGANVGMYKGIPRPGDPAPAIPQIEGSLGRRPVVLLFASPKYCLTRVCSPVVDVATEVAERFGDRADFVHLDIYNHDDPNQGVRPEVREYNLPSEPWLFVIAADGKVDSVVEGAFGAAELTGAVEEVLQ